MVIDWRQFKCRVADVELEFISIAGLDEAREIQVKPPPMICIPYEELLAAKGWLITHMGGSWSYNKQKHMLRRYFIPEDYLEMSLILIKLKELGVQMEDIQWPEVADKQESS